MSFLPDWLSQGVQGQDNNGGFGTANMFNQPTNRGDLTGLINALRNKFSATPQDSSIPDMNSLPSFTPYQQQSMGPDMSKTQSAYGMSPNGQMMPNWNKTYGGY